MAAGYDPRFAQAAADRVNEQMQAKANCAAGMTAPTPALNTIRGIEVQFLANGFLVAPQMDYLGSAHRIAHVARDRDELLKLVGEMIDAHAK
jgi:hypothetical protein